MVSAVPVASPVAPSAASTATLIARVKPHNPASAQVNARIDPNLKERGDKGLNRAGISPTQAVRALWELAARYSDDPEALLDILYPDRADQAARNARREQMERARALEQGPEIVREAYRASGLPWPTSAEAVSYNELMEEAYAERYGSGLGWDR